MLACHVQFLDSLSSSEPASTTKAESGSQSDPLEAAWQALLDAWPEEGAHRKFLALAETLDRLPDAGSRYRGIKDEALRAGDTARAAEAEAGIERLITRAMGRMELHRQPPDPKPRRIVLGLGVVLVLALFGFALSYLYYAR